MIKTLQKKNLEQKYGRSHFKFAFGINFGLREVVKRKIRKYAYFPFDHFPKSKIDSESNIIKSQKMDFPLYFKIVISK